MTYILQIYKCMKWEKMPFFKVYCIHNEHAQYVLIANICKGTYKSKLITFTNFLGKDMKISLLSTMVLSMI